MKNTDIIVTGGHAILVDELTEEQKEKQNELGFHDTLYDKKFLLACFCDDFEGILEKTLFNIYHIVLENEDSKCHYGIYTENNILTETCPEEYFLTHLI